MIHFGQRQNSLECVYSTLPHWCTAPGRAGYGTALLLPDWCRLL